MTRERRPRPPAFNGIPKPSILPVDGRRLLLCPEFGCLTVTQGVPSSFRADVDQGIEALKLHLMGVHKIPEAESRRRARNASYEQRQ